MLQFDHFFSFVVSFNFLIVNTWILQHDFHNEFFTFSHFSQNVFMNCYTKWTLLKYRQLFLWSQDHCLSIKKRNVKFWQIACLTIVKLLFLEVYNIYIHVKAINWVCWVCTSLENNFKYQTRKRLGICQLSSFKNSKLEYIFHFQSLKVCHTNKLKFKFAKHLRKTCKTKISGKHTKIVSKKHDTKKSYIIHQKYTK